MKKPCSHSLGLLSRNHCLIHFSLGDFRRRYWIRALLLLVLPLAHLPAEQLKEARVSQVIRDVKLLPEHAAPVPAKVSDEVRDGIAVRTGAESRTELTFTDQTLARLGANTIFTFNEGTRNLELGGGAMLLRVPKNAGGAEIHTSAVSAAITGTTVMLEYHPNAYIKFIVLEGTGRIFRKDHLGESVLVHAGQMLIVNPKGTTLPDPVDVDLKRLMQTSLLIIGFAPLPSGDLIAREINVQTEQKSGGDLVDTNLVIFGAGTVISLLDPTNSDVINQANSNSERQPTPPPPPPPPPTGTPSKLGTLSVITSPTPYEIGSGTTIQTDPAITTNGVTDYGKIYRGPEIDGPASAYAFGSTSAFDTTSGFDDRIATSGAAFKFTSLRLTGNPTILTTGGEINLGLIAVNGITSGGPGGTLTFAGIEGLLLATQNGSITLGSEISFAGLKNLTFYARGAGSNLTLGCSISTLKELNLYSEGAVNLSGEMSTVTFLSYSGGDFNLTAGSIDAQTISVFAGGDLNIGLSTPLVLNSTDLFFQAAGSIGINDSLEITQVNDGQTPGLNATLVAGSDLTVGSDLTILLDNSAGGTLNGSAGISLIALGNLTSNGSSDFSLTIANNNGGGILGGANLLVTSFGDLTTTSRADLTIDNSAFNGSDFGVGGSIASDALIGFSAANVSIGSGFFTFLFNDGGGHIDGNALLVGAIAGNFTTGGNLFFDLQNSADTNGEALLSGGTIDGNGMVSFVVGGNIISQGLGEFAVLNNDLRFLDGGGTIGGDATVIVSAAGISTTGFFQPLVNNTNGIIGGTASVTVDAPGDISVGAETFFNILNSNGSIGGDATSTLNAANYSSGSNFAFQILNDRGSIGGNALLVASVSGALTSGGDAFIQITNGGGSIGGDATIDIDAGSFSANSLLLQIDNADGFIGGTSNINFTTDADLTVNGDGAFTSTVDNSLGGQIGAGGDILITTGGDFTGGASDVLIDNSIGGSLGTGGNILVTTGGDLVTASGGAAFTIQNTNGTIGTGGNLTLTVGGDLATQALTLFVENYDGISTNIAGHIGTGGNLFVTTGGDLTADSIDALINNRSGGTIDSGASMIFSIGGTLTTTGDAGFTISSRLDDEAPNGSMLGSVIGSDVTLLISANNVNIGGTLRNDFFGNTGSFSGISNSGSTINGSATYTWDISGDTTIQGDAALDILNDSDAASPLGGTIHGNATIQVNAASLTTGSLLVYIDNQSGGVIDSDAALNLAIAGNLTSHADATFQILNKQHTIIGNGGGSIGADATINVSALNITANGLFGQIFNDGGGNIGGNANITFDVSGAIDTQGDATFQILDNDNGDGSGPGTIESDAMVSVSAADISTGGSLFADIYNFGGGNIGGSANINFNLTGDLTAQGDAIFLIDNSIGGTIGSDANITLTVGGSLSTQGFGLLVTNYGDIFGFPGTSVGQIGAGGNISVTTEGNLATDFVHAFINNRNGASINSGATISFNIGGALTTLHDDPSFLFGLGDSLDLLISNRLDTTAGGTIGSDATINLTAASVSTGGSLSAAISNNNLNIIGASGGNIGGSAIINFGVSGDLIAQGDAVFDISSSGGRIGSDATINVNAVNISTDANPVTTGLLSEIIFNENGGTIGSDANITFNLTGNLTTQGDAGFSIFNQNSGTIGGNAMVSVSAANLTANSLLAEIFNIGGTIGGDATIDMNVSGSATVTNDATVQILGSDGAAAAAINFNGGSYDAGGTFLALTDGNGAITFTNASVHADVLKVGALGTNGVLTIGGGSLSGDTMLKLYAGGSSGRINFVSNVTLSSETNVLVAANTVTINNGIIVTIAGDDGANAFVFTNVPNYTGSGGNGATTGTFDGNGAQTFPLDQAPPFDDPGAPGTPDAPAKGSTTSVGTTAPTRTTNPGLPGNRDSGANTIISRSRPRVAIAKVADSNELLDLADKVTSGPIETGHSRSNAPAGRKTSRGPGNAWSRKGRPLSPARLTPADVALARSGARRPSASP